MPPFAGSNPAAPTSFSITRSPKAPTRLSSGNPALGVATSPRRAGRTLASARADPDVEAATIDLARLARSVPEIGAGLAALLARQHASWTMPGWTMPGWTMPGDVGYLDDDGLLFLTDRKARDDHFGGVNIYPREAENLLITHPKVADMVVIGMPDPDRGQGHTKRITG